MIEYGDNVILLEDEETKLLLRSEERRHSQNSFRKSHYGFLVGKIR